jgi:hypothetical protein
MLRFRVHPGLAIGGMLVALALASPLAAQAGAKPAVTGTCKDGTTTTATHKIGACSKHGGVATWTGAAAAAADSGKASASSPSKPAAKSKATTKDSTPTKSAASAKSGASKGAPAGATGLCNDGSYTKAAHREGACSHHGGIKEWLAGTHT